MFLAKTELEQEEIAREAALTICGADILVFPKSAKISLEARNETAARDLVNHLALFDIPAHPEKLERNWYAAIPLKTAKTKSEDFLRECTEGRQLMAVGIFLLGQYFSITENEEATSKLPLPDRTRIILKHIIRFHLPELAASRSDDAALRLPLITQDAKKLAEFLRTHEDEITTLEQHVHQPVTGDAELAF